MNSRREENHDLVLEWFEIGTEQSRAKRSIIISRQAGHAHAHAHAHAASLLRLDL